MKEPGKLNSLLLKLENLEIRQRGFEQEIQALREEIAVLQGKSFSSPAVTEKTAAPAAAQTQAEKNRFSMPDRPGLEKFIGENLVSKAGILVLILGVAIGAKYAVDRDLVSPLTRIILGALTGTTLMVLAFWLKKKYGNFSAVLVSGGIAILYFMSYAAYSFYGLFSQQLAFGIMTVFTLFSVFIATWYNRQFIAHIGLVGAYAIPFLLGNGSGRATVLFAYISIINAGILFISLKKYWQPLFYLAFAVSWTIFLSWCISADSIAPYVWTALLFAFVFFMIFQLTNLAYKLIRGETLSNTDLIVQFINSLIFYLAGYYLLTFLTAPGHTLSLFAVFNAGVHLAIGLLIRKRLPLDSRPALLHFLLGIAFIYLTFRLQITAWFGPAVKDQVAKVAWIYIYSLFFMLAVSAFAIRKIKETATIRIILLINLSLILAFLTWGHYNLARSGSGYVRYLSVLLSVLLLLASAKLLKQNIPTERLLKFSGLFFHFCILWTLSSEFIHLLSLAGLYGSYKLGMSILWGAYALLLIIIGLARHQAHLRIAAISLFGITLVKLFTFDLVQLGTVAKTVILVSLGILMLIISFLYTRYKTK